MPSLIILYSVEQSFLIGLNLSHSITWSIGKKAIIESIKEIKRIMITVAQIEDRLYINASSALYTLSNSTLILGRLLSISSWWRKWNLEKWKVIKCVLLTCIHKYILSFSMKLIVHNLFLFLGSFMCSAFFYLPITWFWW